MATSRPFWKGYLKLSLVSCPIAMFPASSSSERVSFRQINKSTGNRLKQQLVDSVTGDVVDAGQKGRGYEIGRNQFMPVEDEELEALRLESTHTIDIEKFVPRSEIDERYLDSPYYLAPTDNVGQDAFAVIREAMKRKNMVGFGRAVISRRERIVMLEPFAKGLMATTLRYAYEVRDTAEYFDDIPSIKLPGEMIELAEHILDTKAGPCFGTLALASLLAWNDARRFESRGMIYTVRLRSNGASFRRCRRSRLRPFMPICASDLPRRSARRNDSTGRRQMPVSKKRRRKKSNPQSSKGTSTRVALPDPRAMEAFMSAISGREADDAMAETQQVMYVAGNQTSSRARVALAHKALAISPLCADAYVLLAEEEAKSVDEALEYYRKGVEVAEQALGTKGFKEYAGHFWGFLETRPYMRARAGLAATLYALGEVDAAISNYQDMLTLNPNDNQGIRYVLARCLMRKGDTEALKK